MGTGLKERPNSDVTDFTQLVIDNWPSRNAIGSSRRQVILIGQETMQAGESGDRKAGPAARA